MPARQAPSTTPDSAALPLQIVKEAFAVSFLTILFLVKLKIPFRHTFPIYSIEIHLLFLALLAFLWHTRPPTSSFAFSTEKTSHGNQNRFSFIKNTNWWRKIQWSSKKKIAENSCSVLLQFSCPMPAMAVSQNIQFGGHEWPAHALRFYSFYSCDIWGDQE